MSTPLSRVIQARLSYLEMSKEQLSDRSGLGRSTIYAFVAGTRTDPQGSTLRKLAEGLGMTTGELVQAVNGVPEPAPETDARIARIVELLPSIPKDRLDAIEQHVTLAVQPTRKESARGRRDRANNPSNSLVHERDAAGTPPEELGAHGSLSTVSSHRRAIWASVVATISGLLQASTPWAPVEAH